MSQVVVARVHGLATAAGCQLVAACDLAVAAEWATFARFRGQGRVVLHHADGRGGPGRGAQASDGAGLHRRPDRRPHGRSVGAGGARYVPDDDLDVAVGELLAHATRGSASARALAKPALYAQLGLPLDDAYRLAVEVMAK